MKSLSILRKEPKETHAKPKILPVRLPFLVHLPFYFLCIDDGRVRFPSDWEQINRLQQYMEV